MKKTKKDLEKREMIEIPMPGQDNILVLLWDDFPNVGEMLWRLEHWAEHYAWTNYNLGKKRKSKMWEDISFFFWKLRHKL